MTPTSTAPSRPVQLELDLHAAAPSDEGASAAQLAPAAPITPASVHDAAKGALRAAVIALFGTQHADGHWCAELEGDSILNTEYLLMKAILGQTRAPEATPDDLRRFDKMLAYVRMLQRSDGTWGQYPGAPPDLSACVKAYFALKLWGESPEATHMQSAREAIRLMGGAERINTFSMFYLACLGQVSWDACPSIPPEIVLLPRRSPFHLDKVAAWTRTMILPLALCTALRPVRPIEPERRIDELFLDPSRAKRLCKDWDAERRVGWTNFFLGVDRALKVAQKSGLVVTRRAAIRRAEEWLLERMDPRTTDGLGAIFPPMVYIQVAFQAMGYERTNPVIVEAEKQLDRFIVEEADHVRIQPCFSPVWDTGIALYALTEAGYSEKNDARIRKCCEWLRANEVRITGDWHRNLRPADRELRLGPDPVTGAPPSAAAWAFEYRNDWYPDVDDTAMVAKALRRAGDGGGAVLRTAVQDVGSESRPTASASARATRWLVAMQNDDGGWAAFDRTRDRPWMEKVPFADHNAMQDPSCADITGRTIEALITCGVPRDHVAVRRAVQYLRREQRDQGCWWGRWGCNFLYGTWQAVGGLAAAGELPAQPHLRKALAWLRAAQNADGGFGETADSYLDESRMARGPSAASQTSWGAMALMYLSGPGDPAVERAMDYLCRTQLPHDAPPEALREIAEGEPAPGFLLHDAQAYWQGRAAEAPAPARPRISHPLPELAGSWREGWFTGTGFPKVFYLRYHAYRRYFPVMALARYLRLKAQQK